jgi:hypothetical protein
VSLPFRLVTLALVLASSAVGAQQRGGIDRTAADPAEQRVILW